LKRATTLLLPLLGLAVHQAAIAADTLSARSALRYLRKHRNTLILDVRKASEYNEGHLSKARNISYHDKNFADSLATLNRKLPIVVYCATGRRSANTLRLLDSLGFHSAYHVRGGIVAWKAAKLPTVK
jgi:thioredoxin 1